MKKLIAILILALAVQVPAHAQLGGLLNKAKDAVKKETQKAVDKAEEKLDRTASAGTSGAASGSGKAVAKGEIPKGTKTIYVSANKGSNRNDGSKSSPLKDLQRAVDDAPEGAVILVAQGNYLGKLDAGYISIKKYISIVGGYSDDFSERDPLKYRTMIQPGSAAGGTNANYGLLDIYVRGKRTGVILIDGMILDKGQMNKYVIPNPPNPKFKAPEGLESSLLNPPGKQINQPSISINVILRNDSVRKAFTL